MFGAKWIMFCSPQPYGIWIRESRPLMEGPRMSPSSPWKPDKSDTMSNTGEKSHVYWLLAKLNMEEMFHCCGRLLIQIFWFGWAALDAELISLVDFKPQWAETLRQWWWVSNKSTSVSKSQAGQFWRFTNKDVHNSILTMCVTIFVSTFRNKLRPSTH